MKLFFFLSFTALVLLAAHGFNAETDKQALLEFKSQVSEEKKLVLSSWNHSFPLCNWKGVSCGRKQKRVSGLDVGGFSLGGLISPSIGNLSFLISLDLSRNSFGGSIPQEVGNLFRLEYFDMGLNFLGGKIPIGLYNCSRLLQLRLDRNRLEGGLSSEVGSLTKLVKLKVYLNNLRGKLPASLGNLTSLDEILLSDNNLEGEIPRDVDKLTQITKLHLHQNNFSGVFPPAIYNLSSLRTLGLAHNHFSGSLRSDFGIVLPNLRLLIVGGNDLTGYIPATLSNISSLQTLGLHENSLTGSIPATFGEIPKLKLLTLQSNSLGRYSSGDFEFVSSLTNCTQLEQLWIGGNKLGGDFPISIVNLSAKLTTLDFGGTLVSGRIPHDIGNLISLQTLLLDQCMLIGPLPASLGKLLNLRVLTLFSNRLSGVIPAFIGNITMLEKLILSNNSFEGIVPPSLGNCSNLLQLYIDSNKLNGTIPREILKVRPLIILDMSWNSLRGSLPEDIGQLENLVTLSVAYNKLSWKLPQTMGKCLTMVNLSLEGNNFDGDIPDIEGLLGLQMVDFSNNNLSGRIPEYLINFSKLQHLNLSVNRFVGRVPTKGIFQNTTIVSVFGNNDLCGGITEFQLKACLPQEPMDSRKSSRLKKVAIGISVGIALLLMLSIASVYLIWLRKRKKNNQTDDPTLGVFHENISYGDLRNATDCFSLSNMVGSGSFGTVFKAFLPTENKIVAVKVLNLQRHGAMKSFMAECQSLRDIRHRNLVKLLTACSSIDFQGNEFRALIYEFMPNGSLDMWLHPEQVEEIRRPSRTLTLLERLNIAIDLAYVLDYLHVHCHEPIAHCDLKPSNILLDDDLTAHVSDFGLARLLLKFDQESFLNQLSSAGVRGSIGYSAPEYGMGAQPSIHGDVYSFGILLLEMFTGKRPANELFGGNVTLFNYTKSALQEKILDIVDKSILHKGLRVGFPIAECLTLVLNVGLMCGEESPMNRLAMSEAAKELVSIRERFFKARRAVRH